MRNKKKRLTLCLAISLLLQGLLPLGAFADTSNPGTFGADTVKTFGGKTDEYAQDVAFNADGSYVVLVNTSSDDRNLTGIISKREAENASFLLVKYSANHVMQWMKPTKIPANNQAASVKATSDNGYIIASSVNEDGYVLKMDGEGTKVWDTYIKGSDQDNIKQVMETSTHDGYIIVGDTKSNDGAFQNMNSYKVYKDLSAFITKLNADGEIQWTNVLDGQGRDIGTGIAEMPDSYMFLGITASTQNDFAGFNLHGQTGAYDLFLAKVDKNSGELQGTPQSFGDVEREDLTAVLPVADGGFVVLGSTGSTGGQLAAGSGSNFLAKFDASGTLLWATRFGEPLTWTAYNILEISPDVYAVGAQDEDDGGTNFNFKNTIYIIDAMDESNVRVSVEDAPFRFQSLTHLAGAPEQWMGIGAVVPGYPLPDELFKGDQDVAMFHPGSMSDEEAVAEAIYDPVMEFAGDDYLQWITANFKVNTQGVFGTNLTWTSNNPEAVTIDPLTGVATVQQPPKSGADVNVTLTVTGERNGVNASRQIELTVKKQSAWHLLLSGTEDNRLRIRQFKASNDGTLFLYDGDTIMKKGITDTDLIELPPLPVIENEAYSDIAAITVDDTDLYVYRLYMLNNSSDSKEQFELLKLGNDNQWIPIETAAIPEELAPVDEQLGEFTEYGVDAIIVDNGTLYQKVTANYSGGVDGGGSRDLLVKWDGSQWIDVTPGEPGIVIASFAVQDGMLYALTTEDPDSNWSLTISDGANVIYQQELSGNQTPVAEYESRLEVGPDGAVYILNSSSRNNEGYVWKGVRHDNQSMDWSNYEDSYRFYRPTSIAATDNQLFVVDYNYYKGSLIIERSEESSGGGDDNGSTNPVPATGLTVSSSDPSGAAANGKTAITVAPAASSGHRWAYYNFGLGTVTVPNVGDIATGYTDLPNDGLVAAANADVIGVAEVDADGKVVRFGQISAVAVTEPSGSIPVMYYNTIDSDGKVAGNDDKLAVFNTIDGLNHTVLASNLSKAPNRALLDRENNRIFIWDNVDKQIYCYNLQSGVLDLLNVTITGNMGAMAYDYVNQKIYYTTIDASGEIVGSDDKLGVFDLDGSNHQILISRLSKAPTRLLLDIFRNRVLVWDNADKSMSAVDLTSLQVTPLSNLSITGNLSGFAYDPVQDRFIYTTVDGKGSETGNDDKLGIFNADGTGHQILMSSISNAPTQLALDLANDRVWIWDNANKQLFQFDLNSNTISTFNAVTITGSMGNLIYYDGASPTVDLAGSSPANQSANVSATEPIRVKFNEKVMGGRGWFYLYDAVADSQIEEIPVNDPRITGWGTDTLTIDPDSNLSGTVAVRWSRGAVSDYNENYLAPNNSSSYYSFSVASVNTAPSFIGSATALTVNQNTSATDITGYLHVSDPDSGQTLTWSQSIAPDHGGQLSFIGAAASAGGADIAPGGSITYTPANGYSGSETFTIQVSDGVATATRQIMVTVNPSLVSTISSAGLSGMASPAAGATPLSAEDLTTGDESYVISHLEWQNPDGTPAALGTNGEFKAGAVYKAAIELTAASGFKFPAGGLTPTVNIGTAGMGSTMGGDVEGNRLVFSVTFPATSITLLSAEADGVSGLTTSTQINLTFDADLTGLTDNDITITDGTGAVVKGSLSGSGANWSISLTSVATAGNVSVAVAAPGGYSISGSPKTVAVYKAVSASPEATPNAGIDYAEEKLTGFLAGAVYTINGTPVTVGSDGKVAIESTWLGTTVRIVKKGDGGLTTDSAEQLLPIPARPAAPTVVTVTDVTYSGGQNGTLINVTSFMEYKKGSEGSWSDITGTTVNNLPPDTYYVRIKATDTAFASIPVQLTVHDSDAVIPSAPDVTADDVNNLIIGLNTAMEFSVDSGGFVRYDGTNAPDLSGEHTVRVRVGASGSLPAGPATTLIFTANTPFPASGLTVTSSDPSGAENDGRTKIAIMENLPLEHSLAYYNFGSGSMTVPMVGDLLTGYTFLPADNLIAAANGDRIGIAELDPTGKVVRFGQTTAIVRAEPSTTPTTPTTPTSPGSNSPSPSAPATPSPANPAASEGVEILVNGKAENAGKATTTVTQGVTTTTIAVDPAKLQAKLDAEGDRAIVTIPVKSASDMIVGELNGQMVKNMEDRSATLVIKTDQASYTLPAEQINIDSISTQFGGKLKLEDIKVRISIAETSGTMNQVVKSAEEAGRFTIVAPALDFKVTGEFEGKTVEVARFNEYIERMVALPDGIDPSRITTGVVVDPDGTVRHVPTKVVIVEGKYYAVINSLTNSTYSVVWHPIEFSDVANHWAKAAVNDMGSRMVIDGIGNGKFSPDAAITRAEFAAIVVRGLGLKLGEGANPFSDVAADAWYAGAVQTASTYGLITGFEDGSFRPNAKITREQAMTIVAKAMKLTGLADKLDKADSQSILAGFADGSTAGNWARESIAITIQAEIVNGKDHGKLEPAAYVSRAEVASLIQRLLSKSDLI